MKKPLKLPRKTSRVYNEIFRRGYAAGYQCSTDTIKATADKVVVKNDVEMERFNIDRLKFVGQGIQSLTTLGEAYARIFMYGIKQR